MINKRQQEIEVLLARTISNEFNLYNFEKKGLEKSISREHDAIKARVHELNERVKSCRLDVSVINAAYLEFVNYWIDEIGGRFKKKYCPDYHSEFKKADKIEEPLGCAKYIPAIPEQDQQDTRTMVTLMKFYEEKTGKEFPKFSSKPCEVANNS